MRDYINRLSRGSSIIKVPKMSCSEEQITMDISVIQLLQAASYVMPPIRFMEWSMLTMRG